MNTIAKFFNKNRGSFSLALCGICAFGVLRMTEAAQLHFDRLAIEGIDTANRTKQGKIGFENLPLIFAQAAEDAKAQPSVVGSPVDIDAAFLPPVSEKKADISESVRTDYFKLLPQAISVGGVSGGGALLADEYISFGSKMNNFSYPGPDGHMIAPILSGRVGNFLIIKEPGKNGRTERIPL